MTELTLINTNLRRQTFESPKIKEWVESRSHGKVLNLFAGTTKLNLDEVRNDLNPEVEADYHMDAYDFVKKWKGPKFDTIILDPPYSYRKSMEMYNGYKSSKFKLIADAADKILAKDGVIISFGYHSTFMGKKRKYELKELCVFAHGGAQHCTIGIIETRKPKIKNFLSWKKDATTICGRQPAHPVRQWLLIGCCIFWGAILGVMNYVIFTTDRIKEKLWR